MTSCPSCALSFTLAFEREGIVLDRTPSGRDNDALYSPTIREVGGTLSMIYTGQCYSSCAQGTDVMLLAAASTDGRTWAKQTTHARRFAWTINGVGEATLFQDGDGPAPLVTGGLRRRRYASGWNRLEGLHAAGVLALSVLVEGHRTWGWFFGLSKVSGYAIGYAEAAPLSASP